MPNTRRAAYENELRIIETRKYIYIQTFWHGKEIPLFLDMILSSHLRRLTHTHIYIYIHRTLSIS